MPIPVIVSATRTPIARAYKGALVHTSSEELAATIVKEAVQRARIDPAAIDDVILAESLYGGGDLARYAAVVAGMANVPGHAVNRHCAGSLTAIGIAAAQIASGMENVVVAGGVQSLSTQPLMTWRTPGSPDEVISPWIPPSHPETADAPNRDMSITVGWNTAQAAGISRADMDAWALRSHQRAIAAIDGGRFDQEIVTLTVTGPDGARSPFTVDEHPRRDTTAERLASLPVLHPEIDGFSITAGNSSGTNDAAAVVTVSNDGFARAESIPTLATVKAWTSVGVAPRDTGLGAVRVIAKLLGRAGISARDVKLWEINEAFASVPIAACREYGLDEEKVNTSGSGCSLGHPIAASGARMVTTLVHQLLHDGGGIGVAAMCAGGGQGGAVLVEV